MTEKIMLGEFIYKRRKELGLSQAELGEKVGVSNKAVSKWETGESNPDLKLALPLSKALKCTADELLSCSMSENESNDNQSNDAEYTDKDEYKAVKLFGVAGREKNNCCEYEFISDKQNVKRDPFLHIHFGKKLSNINTEAKGTIAIGNVANGKLAIGLVARGLFSIGFISIGIISVGVLAIGLLLAFGSLAFGLGASFGAIAVGSLAVGAITVGVYSVGAIAIGIYAHTGGTGIAFGIHTFYH